MVALVEPSSLVVPRWRTTIGLIALGILFTITIFLPTYADIFNFWWNRSSYNHCLLIVPITCYLIWLKRDTLLATSPHTSFLGIIYIAGNGLLWMIGDLMSINLLLHLGAFGFIVGLVWTFIGTRNFRLLLFPLLYLYFGVPEGDFLVPYLQDLTATVVVILLRASEIPVYLEGRYLTIPSGSFHVAKACSGINYLIATLAVGSMFAYLRFYSYWRRSLFMLLAILVPLAANGMRAYGIVMIAHLSDYKYAMGIDHFIYGWFFFGIVIFALFSVGNLFSDVEDLKQKSIPVRGEQPQKRIWTPVAILLIVSILAGVKAIAASATSIRYSSADFELPNSNGRWRLSSSESSTLGSSFFGAEIIRFGTYTSSDKEEEVVDVEAYYYRRHSQGAEVVNIVNEIFDDERWRRLEGPTTRKIDASPIQGVTELRLRFGAHSERLVWYWFDISGSPTINAFEAKAYSIVSALKGDYMGEAAVIISTPIGDDIEASTDLLRSFIREVGLTLDNMAN